MYEPAWLFSRITRHVDTRAGHTEMKCCNFLQPISHLWNLELLWDQEETLNHRVYAEIHYLWEKKEMPKVSVAGRRLVVKAALEGRAEASVRLWALYQVTGSSCLPLGKGKKHSHHSFQAKKYHCRGRSKHVSHFPLWESQGNLLGPRLGSDAKWRSPLPSWDGRNAEEASSPRSRRTGILRLTLGLRKWIIPLSPL